MRQKHTKNKNLSFLVSVFWWSSVFWYFWQFQAVLMWQFCHLWANHSFLKKRGPEIGTIWYHVPSHGLKLFWRLFDGHTLKQILKFRISGDGAILSPYLLPNHQLFYYFGDEIPNSNGGQIKGCSSPLTLAEAVNLQWSFLDGDSLRRFCQLGWGIICGSHPYCKSIGWSLFSNPNCKNINCFIITFPVNSRGSPFICCFFMVFPYLFD